MRTRFVNQVIVFWLIFDQHCHGISYGVCHTSFGNICSSACRFAGTIDMEFLQPEMIGNDLCWVLRLSIFSQESYLQIIRQDDGENASQIFDWHNERNERSGGNFLCYKSLLTLYLTWWFPQRFSVKLLMTNYLNILQLVFYQSAANSRQGWI